MENLDDERHSAESAKPRTAICELVFTSAALRKVESLGRPVRSPALLAEMETKNVAAALVPRMRNYAKA